MKKYAGKISLILIFCFLLGCNKETDNSSPQPTSSTTTLVINGHNQTNQARIILVSLSTDVNGSTKKSSLTGRCIKFSQSYGTELDNTINSIFFEIDQKGNELSDKDIVAFFEEKLKLTNGYATSSAIPQQQLLSMLKVGQIDLALQKLKSDSFFDDVLLGLFSTPAYAQTTNPDKIILDIVKGAVNQVKGCFGGTSAKCVKSIKDLAKATGKLWDYIADEVGKAMNPDDNKSAGDVYDDLQNSPTSNTGGNSQNVSPSPTGGSYGEPHLTTMDGFYYDFQGYGEFIAVKSTTDAFEIQARQQEIEPYRNGKVTMNTALAINTGSDIICLFPNEVYINKQKFTFTLNGQREFALKQGSATLSNNFFTVQSAANDIIRVNIQNLGQGFLDYRVTLNETRKGKVKGLLGNFDGNTANDVQTQDGKIVNPFIFADMYPAFANSWRISDTNSYFEYPTGKKTADYSKTDYPKLNADIDATLRTWAENVCRVNGITDEPYFSSCVMDVALSGSDRYFISALGAEESKLRLTSFEINKFTSFEELNLTPHGGSPTIENGLLYITKPQGAAAVYQKYKIDITTGFEVNIDFAFTEPGGIVDAKGELGADGIAFIIQDYNSRLVPPSSGQGLGYNGLPRSLAIEFDTYTNAGQDSPDADIWLNTQGVNPNSVADATTLIKPQTRPIANLVDGKVHKAVIRYVKKTSTTYKLDVFVDGETNPYLTADNINIQNIIGAYSSGVYLGISAATAGGYQNHVIHRWAYKPL
ncbi:VWD domain-containing protein [Fibrella forsythiae]|uniref:VWD domain-containing protein n=1 Tax=Fibrella forsythiae TaxID=2817061 RepID=A0ABS3JID2_9BACT|nr:VWD domain-containing protein [Fibrella forsythiae]MBO0949763.1 VWD domain-containing protein [Fibrella forsythiae]